MAHLKKRSRRKKRPKAVDVPLDPQTHPHAAGIDVGAEELVAAVPISRCLEPVRTYSSFTAGVLALRDWFLECGIKTVAIESTGNYWITTYNVLEEAGLEVYLVNARHVRGVPGKKTDVCDAQWLQQLHAAGLLRKSFRPDKEIAPLRFLMRYRSELVAQGARHLQHLQKVCTEMNLHIHHVFSDIDGESAQRIMNAVLNGERDAKVLAALRDYRCRTPEDKVMAALQGDYRPEYLFVLGQAQKLWQQTMQAIAECDLQLSQMMQSIPRQTQEPLPPAPATQRREHKNSLALPIYEEAWRFFGVDLSAIPGVGGTALATLMTELGTSSQILKAFPSAQRFTSWLGLCPDNRISGGKILKAKTRRVPHRVSGALRMAAAGLRNSQTLLGEYCRRMKGRLGKAEGITATAHKLARIIYAMIQKRQPYNEQEAFKVTPITKARRVQRLIKQAEALGLTLVAAS